MLLLLSNFYRILTLSITMYCTNRGAKMAISWPIPLAIPVMLDANLGDKSTELTKCPEGKAPENRLPIMYKPTTIPGLSMKDNVSSIIMYMY